LRKSPDLHLKHRILELLIILAKQDCAAVMEVLQRTWQYDKNPQVRQMALAALQRVYFRLMMAEAHENEADRLRTTPNT
jgi:hypothetical protein